MILGSRTPLMAPENDMYICWRSMANENTATATVPDTAPRMNCPVLQYMRSMMVFRKIQKE